jgi:GNAT superfamily N-acetyltransferase
MSDETLPCRVAVPDDQAALMQLIRDSVRGLSTGYYSAEQIESALIHVFGVDSQLIADGTYYVVEMNGQMAGCGGWSRRRTLYGGDQWKAGTEDNLLDPATEAARIRAFFVHQDQARKGIGRQLLAVCEEAAYSYGFTVIELMATLPGEPFYRVEGYEPLEQVDIPLPNGLVLPCRRMRKLLVR